MRLLALIIPAIGLIAPVAALADDGALQITFESVSYRHPAWSPDGSQIAFCAGADSLALVPASGGIVTRFFGVPGERVGSPTWSPDGNEIAFVRTWDFHHGRGEIWAVPSTGGTPRGIMSMWGGAIPHHDACWSPDGDQIVYSEPPMNGWGGILTVPAKGGGLPTQITPYGRDPYWSPDGSQIAFVGTHLWEQDIWVIPAAGGTAKRITRDGGNPAWSPDGNLIAFASMRSGNNDIWMIPAAGGTATQLTEDPAADYYPTWSPDGSRIAFQSDRSGSWEIWVIDVQPPVSIEQQSWGTIKNKYRE
jgi:Tol biopolymer transport system component